MVRLISPVIPVTDEPQLCFSFWYAAFGAGESALLQIMRQDNSSGETPAEKVGVIFCYLIIYNTSVVLILIFLDLEFRSKEHGHYKTGMDACTSNS